ncbi:hypothetical protein [Arthrobacter sp. MAHUQ-56]
MTLQSYLAEEAAYIPRGGSYVTLPAGSEVPPRIEGSYVSLPGALPGNASKDQGTYVTLHSAPAGPTEISYTRVG